MPIAWQKYGVGEYDQLFQLKVEQLHIVTAHHINLYLNEVEAMTNCREGKKGQYGSLRHLGTELSLHGRDGMLFILLW